MRRILALAVTGLLTAAPLAADPPRVVTDIAPVHSLAALVMDGVAAPDLLLRPGLTPHAAALKPSQAGVLQDADLVIWIGPELTPWLAEALDSLASDAGRLNLLDAPVTLQLAYRDLGVADDEADNDGHDHDDDDDHGHGHRGTDPHAWLDPRNGAAWLGLIAEALAARDPENAARYRANAAAGQARLAALETDLSARLAPARDRRFIAQHDAYQYFDTRFGLALAATVAPGAATDPGPARLAALRDLVAGSDIACAFREPQYNDGALRVATEGAGIPLAVLDPLGGALTPGPDLYPALLQDMAGTIVACLAD